MLNVLGTLSIWKECALSIQVPFVICMHQTAFLDVYKYLSHQMPLVHISLQRVNP